MHKKGEVWSIKHQFLFPNIGHKRDIDLVVVVGKVFINLFGLVNCKLQHGTRVMNAVFLFLIFHSPIHNTSSLFLWSSLHYELEALVMFHHISLYNLKAHLILFLVNVFDNLFRHSGFSLCSKWNMTVKPFLL